MRTTIRLDDRVEARLRELAHAQGKRFGQVVNETLRAGMGVSAGRSTRSARHAAARGHRWTHHGLDHRRPFKVRAKRCGFLPGVDVEKLNQLVDEMDVEDFGAEAIRDRA